MARVVDADAPQTYRSWGDVAIAAFVIVCAVLFALLGLTGESDFDPWLYAAIVLVITGVWVGLVRPAVTVAPDRVVLRDMLATVTIPTGAIEGVQVLQMLIVTTAGQTFDNTALNRSRREISRDEAALSGHAGERSGELFLAERIQRLAETDRVRRDITLGSAEHEALDQEIRRVRAWPEIVLLVGSAVLAVVLLVVG